MGRKKGIYKQLQQCKTLKEIGETLPESFYNKGTFYLLLFWCLMPVGAFVISWCFGTDADLYMYLSCLGLGFLLLYVWLLKGARVSYEFSKGDFLKYVKLYLPQLSLFLMLFWSLLASFHARDYNRAFIGEGYSHEGFLTYVAYAGFYGAALLLSNKKMARVLIDVTLLVSGALSLLTIVQYSGVRIPGFDSHMRLAGIFHNTNHFGYYLCITAVGCCGMYLIAKSQKLRLYYILNFMVILTALILNNTFGAYLGVMAGLCAIVIIFSLWHGSFKGKFLIPLLVGILVSVVVNLSSGLVFNNFSQLKKDTTMIVEKDEFAGRGGSGRWIRWVHAVDFIFEEPMLGYGPDNLDYNYALVGVDELKPHNEYLQFAACLGIPGLVFYMISLCGVYWRAFKERLSLDPLRVVSLCVLSGYLVSALFGNTKFYVTPTLMMFLAWATFVNWKGGASE